MDGSDLYMFAFVGFRLCVFLSDADRSKAAPVIAAALTLFIIIVYIITYYQKKCYRFLTGVNMGCKIKNDINFNAAGK